jgi:DNA-binding transcriptional regulator YhcF (GntR family)
MEPSQTRESLTQNCDRFVEGHRRLLEQAVEKVVRVAAQVGVTPEEIISMLDSGISIRDLLAFLASKRSGLA